MPPNGGLWYFEKKHFEAVWRDIAYVLENHILPQIEAMTEDIFVSRLLERSKNDSDFLLAHQTVSLEYLYYPGTPEAAIYGVALWRLGEYEEGAVYLTYARQKYRDWLKTYAAMHKNSGSLQNFVLFIVFARKIGTLLMIIDKSLTCCATCHSHWKRKLRASSKITLE